MKLRSSMLRNSLVLLAVILALPAFRAAAQSKPEATSAQVAQAKSASPSPAPAANGEQAEKKLTTRGPGHEDADQLKRREEWFYRQRAYPLGYIPAGARLRAFEHMQRMMEAEGKIVRQPTGEFAAATVSAASTPAWNPIGPAPTTGGFFSPVTGRVTAIAVDPTDTTGNTVLIGGAQGGIWRSIDAGATWTPETDFGPSLAMGSIAFAPSQPGTVYAGTGEQTLAGDAYYGAGILKSTNGGQTWTPTCPTPGPTCNNPFIGPFGSGFFPGGGARISYLTVNPANPNLILAGVEIFTGTNAAGVYCSNDGGLNWTNILPGQMSTFVGYASSSLAFAALGRPFGTSTNGTNPNGIYRSSNASGSCSAVTFTNQTTTAGSGLPTTNIGRIDMGIDSTGNTIYASIADSSMASSTNQGVWKTTNGGTSWTKTGAPDICQQQCWYDNVVKVDPNNPMIVFFGGSSATSSTSFEWIIRSTNGGSTWSPAIPTAQGPGTPHVDQHAMAFFRATSGAFAGKVRMYLGNDGGIWRNDDAEAPVVNWTNLNGFPLQLAQFYPSLSIHPSNPSLAFAGTQDNGSQNFTGRPLSPTNDWTDNQSCGDGGWTVIDPATPSTVYVECQDISVQKSVTNGTPNSFNLAVNGIDPTDGSSFIAPLTIDPANPNRLYFGGTHLWQTTDGASSWQSLNGGSTLSGKAHIVAVAVGGGSNGNVVYAATNADFSVNPPIPPKVFVATNVAPGTGTFSQVGAGQFPNRTPTQIIVDRSDLTGNTAYVTYSGFSGFGDQLGHIFQTVNGGASWVDVSTGLPNIPVNDLVIDPDVVGTLYVATDLGVFITSNGGATWATFNNNSLPNVAVFSLRLHEPSRTLRAATHGRGAWDLALTNFPFTGPHITDISPTSANVRDPQVSLAVNGSGFTCSSKILFTLNGATDPLAPTFCSAAQLVTVIPGTDLQTSGDAQVKVADPGPPAATSNAMTFTVLGAAPTLTSISPTSTPVQTPNPSTNVDITLNGSNFTANSQVFFNGAQNGITVKAPTAACPIPSCLAATLPAALLGPFGSTDDITAVNPPPGGGSSAAQTFKVVALAPPNDNFASAMSVVLTSNAFTDTKDSSGATTEMTDPTPACVQQFSAARGNTGGHPNGAYNTIWYKFAAPSSGNVQIDTKGSNYDTVLSVWTGSAGSLTAVACNDDINPGIIITSQVNFSATSGTTYYIMVSSFGPPDPNPVAFGGKSVLNFSFTGTLGGGTTATTTAVTSSSTSIASGGSVTLTAKVSTTSNGAGPTGTVQFKNGSAALSTAVPCTPTAGTGTTTAFCTATLTATLAFLAPPSGPTRIPTMRLPPLSLVAFMLLLLLLMGLRRMPAAYRRASVCTGLLLLAGLVTSLVGCGGGYGGGGGGGAHYDSITAVYSGDATYAGSTSPAITITIR